MSASLDGYNKCSVMIAPTVPAWFVQQKEQRKFLTWHTGKYKLRAEKPLVKQESNNTNKNHCHQIRCINFIHKAVKDSQHWLQHSAPQTVGTDSSSASTSYSDSRASTSRWYYIYTMVFSFNWSSYSCADGYNRTRCLKTFQNSIIIHCYHEIWTGAKEVGFWMPDWLSGKDQDF